MQHRVCITMASGHLATEELHEGALSRDSCEVFEGKPCEGEGWLYIDRSPCMAQACCELHIISSRS